MAYVRKQIRDKLKEILETVIITDGRVFYDHFYAIPESKMPCIVVSTGGEQVQKVNIGKPAILEKTLDVNVVAVTILNSNYQNLLSDIALEIEKKINDEINLDGLVQSILITSINQEIDDERDLPIGYITFTVQIIYRIKADNPEVTI